VIVKNKFSVAVIMNKKCHNHNVTFKPASAEAGVTWSLNEMPMAMQVVCLSCVTNVWLPYVKG